PVLALRVEGGARRLRRIAPLSAPRPPPRAGATARRPEAGRRPPPPHLPRGHSHRHPLRHPPGHPLRLPRHGRGRARPGHSRLLARAHADLLVLRPPPLAPHRRHGRPGQLRHALRGPRVLLRRAHRPPHPLVGPRHPQRGVLAGGPAITETIFPGPGVGRLTVQALLNRDFPVVLAAVFVISVTYTLINLLVDLLYGWLRPRTRPEGAGG